MNPSERSKALRSNAALDPEVDQFKRANLALAIIREAEPREQATLEVTAEQPIENLSLSELLRLADARGLDLSRPDSTPPELPAAPE